MPRCRACGEEIEFIQLTSGRFHPVESRTHGTYYLHDGDYRNPQLILVLADGTILRGRRGSASESGVLRVDDAYESHFATCPGADQFRRR